MNQRNIAYLDILRIIAIFFIVTIHTAAQTINVLPVKSFSFFVTNSYDCLSFIGVALFVMISGALILREEYDSNIKRLLIHKVMHFVILYYLWKILYQFIYMYENQIPFTLNNLKENLIIKTLINRGFYHLWFLPMLIALYFCVPIIKKGLQSKKNCIYFIVLFFFTYCVIPIIFLFEFPYKYTLMDMYNTYNFQFFGGYLGYFVLGHFLQNMIRMPTRKIRFGIYAIGICSLLALPLLSYSFCYKQNSFSDVVSTPFSPMAFFISVSLFIGLRTFCTKSSWVNHPVVHNLSKLTLGIYLIHPAVIVLFNRFNFKPECVIPIVSIPLLALANILICVIIASLLMKIPILKHLLS